MLKVLLKHALDKGCVASIKSMTQQIGAVPLHYSNGIK